MPTSFTIIINEDQRVALLELIKAAGADQPDAPLEYWVGMLTSLPNDELASPGCLHGFCL